MQQLPSFLTNLDPEIYLSNNYLVCDLETDTSHGDFGRAIYDDNKLLLACWKLGPGHEMVKDGGYWPTHAQWGGEFDMEQLLRDIETADFVVAHNAKYESHWLKRCGMDLRKLFVFDTKLAEYVLLGNLAAGSADLGVPPLSTSLDMCCRRRGLPVKDPVVDEMISHGVNPVRIPREWLEGRCRQDIETTEQVFIDQRKALLESGRLAVQYTRCLLTPVLADIEAEGMALDEEAVTKEYDEAKAAYAALETKMNALTGGINWRSGKQVAEFLYDKLLFPEPKKHGKPDRTPEGKRKTSKKALEGLKATTPEQKEFLALRSELGKLNALLTKNLEFFMGVCKEYGGVFHAELHQTKTATHRLSSTGIPLVFETVVDSETGSKERSVQFQNFPRTLKRLFRAKRPGYHMGEPDGSQLEWRVAAYLSQDPVAMRAVENDEDVHSFTASVLFNKTLEEVAANVKECKAGKKDSWRQLAKPNTFKPVYGGSKGTPAEERYFAAFRKRYPGLASTQADWVNAAVKDKELTTAWGLTYYFPTARMSDSGYANITSTVYNYPVQALATAEIIPIALVYLWHRIALNGLTEKIVIVNTVHDSAPCEVHPDHKQDFIDLAKQCFTHDVYNYLKRVYGMSFNVPLGVGVKIGQRWGVGDEISYNVWPDGREIKKSG